MPEVIIGPGCSKVLNLIIQNMIIDTFSQLFTPQNSYAKQLMSFILSARKPKKNSKCMLVYSVAAASVTIIIPSL